MPALATPLPHTEEYLRRERLAPFRSEYRGGRVVAMAGTSRNHNRIVENLSISVGVQLRERPCNSYSSDLRVSLGGGQRYLYQDFVVTCGKDEFAIDQLDTLVNRVVFLLVLDP